jgi:hypothetical protein
MNPSEIKEREVKIQQVRTIDYSKGKIYKLEPTCQYEDGDVYYGSCTISLKQRFAVHKSQSVSNKCKSHILFDKYGKDNIKIVLIKLFSCNSKSELEIEEGKYQREYKCVNKCIAGRTRSQFYQDNKDRIKQYQQDNKAAILEYHHQFYQDNKDRIKQYQQDNKAAILEYQRQYRQDNKAAISERKKQYYQDNKDKFKQYYQNKKLHHIKQQRHDEILFNEMNKRLFKDFR